MTNKPPEDQSPSATLRRFTDAKHQFFARVRRMSDADFVEAVRDYHEATEDWMGSIGGDQALDRELQCRLLLKNANGAVKPFIECDANCGPGYHSHACYAKRNFDTP